MKQFVIFSDMSTESFIFIEEEKDNTPVEKESLICDRKANITKMYCNEITTFRKRNASIYFREKLEFKRERSENDDKPVRKNCRKVSHYMVYAYTVIPLKNGHRCLRF